MTTRIFRLTVPTLVIAIALAIPAVAANKDIIRLQTQIEALGQQITQMKQGFDERMGVMQHLVEQTTDSVNKIGLRINELQTGLQQQDAASGGRVEQLSTQVQALQDSIDELKAHLARVSKQLQDMESARQTLAAQPSPTAATGNAPSAEVLYNNALRDYNAGQYDLAHQQFGDYLKHYGTTDLAGNAQYYLADIAFRQGSYSDAVKGYDRVLEQYPGGNKTAAAHLKKGLALLELGDQDAAVRELNTLVARYPRSVEATQARDRLKKLSAARTRPRRSQQR
jgi:tol-pal system protein YbgF